MQRLILTFVPAFIPAFTPAFLHTWFLGLGALRRVRRASWQKVFNPSSATSGEKPALTRMDGESITLAMRQRRAMEIANIQANIMPSIHPPLFLGTLIKFSSLTPSLHFLVSCECEIDKTPKPLLLSSGSNHNTLRRQSHAPQRCALTETTRSPPRHHHSFITTSPPFISISS